MRNLKKSWLLIAIALISAVAASYRFYRQNEKKHKPATMAASKPQLVVGTGHEDSIICVTFSPDGKILASGSNDRTIKLWDVATGEVIHTLAGHSDKIASTSFSPDGKTLASGSNDRTIKLWDVTNGAIIRTFTGHTDIVFHVSYSPDGKSLVSGSADHTIKSWDVSTGAVIRSITVTYSAALAPSDSVVALASSPNGKILASGIFDGTIKLWDAVTGRELQGTMGFQDPIFCLAFSPNNKTVAGGSRGDMIILWDTITGAVTRIGMPSDAAAEFIAKLYQTTEGEKYSVRSIAFSPDGKSLASGGYGGRIRLWDVETGEMKRALTGYSDSLASLAFSPDGKTLAGGGGGQLSGERSKGTIKLWDIATDTEIYTLKEHVGMGLSAVCSPDGKTLVSKDLDSIKLWDIATGAIIHTITVKSRAFDFSPDGKTLATSGDGSTKLWNTATGAEMHKLTEQDMYAVAFSPTSKMLAGGSDRTVKLWDVATGAKIRTLMGGAYHVAFSPDGNTLVGFDTFSPNGNVLAGLDSFVVRLWDIATGTIVRTIIVPLGSTVDFGPSGKKLNIVSDTGKKRRTVTSHAGNYSPDGKMLASGSEDGKIKLWDVATGAELHTLTGHTHYISSLAFYIDGKTLISGSRDSTIKLWDASTGVELATLVTFDDGRWVLVTPDGRFDTNRIDYIKGLHWRVSSAPLTPLPIEIFMRDYYEPKLLPRILAREKFKSIRDFSTLNHTQPEVKIVNIEPDSAETVQVTIIVTNVKSDWQKDTADRPLESGVYDLRLFRDGQLVGYAPENNGAVKLNAGINQTLTFPRIKLPRTGVEQVEFSAYAFNADRVKSATDRKTYALTPKQAPIKGRAYLIRLGVNAYEREGLNLRYAANDARRVDDLAAQLAARGEYAEVVSVPLISDYAVTLADGRSVAAQDATLQQVSEGRKRVTENSATKAHLRAVLDVLAGRQVDAALLKQIPNADKLRAARPEDLVLLSASSHGYTDSDGIFYLVPSDTGTADLKSPEFRRHCVSSDELSRWLRDVDAGELVMIVDACHSAAAVEGTDFKPGPMGSRGLGQLSYDKGMRILTATQADNVALEKGGLGLLMRALLVDGLMGWQADYKPRDKSILLTEWLTFGVERVPRLYEEMRDGRTRGTFDPSEMEDAKRQQPALFDFARRRREVVLARQP